MTRTRAAALLVTVAAAMALASACGRPAARSADVPQPATNDSAPAATPDNAVQNAGTTRLVVATVGSLGTVVTDARGYTVYVFAKDKPSVSTCSGACATAWPPLLAGSGEIELQGIDRTLVGTIIRDDGTRQVTLNGAPLYRYAKDSQPGQANGQGAGGTWFAATPDGRQATAASDSGYGY